MQLNFKKAILSPFDAPLWPAKLIILTVTFMFADFPVHIISFFARFLILGYVLQFMHNEINFFYPALPRWKSNLISYTKRGFLVSLAVFTYLLILYFIVWLFPGFGNKFFGYTLLSIVLIVMFVLFLFALCLYADKFELMDAFRLNTMYKMACAAKKEIGLCLLIFTLLIGFATLIIYCFKTSYFLGKDALLVTVFVTYFLKALIQLFFASLFAQTYKIAKSRTSI